MNIEVIDKGRYLVNYTSRVQGTISDQDIQHTENNDMTEVVGIVDGKMLIIETRTGRFWRD